MIKHVLPHNHGNVSDELQSKTPSSESFYMISDILKLMCDEKRLKIFWLLCHCEECVINIAELADQSASATSHNLKILKDAGFVVSRREGKEVYYTVAESPKTKALHEAIENIMEVTCPREESFKDEAVYDSQIGVINEVRNFLVEHVDERYTIEALSAKFLINQTTLKTTFKKVYGKPIASYMKEYRIKYARELILNGARICEAAQSVGYENQSKFSRAFKEVTGELPGECRRRACSNSKEKPSP